MQLKSADENDIQRSFNNYKLYKLSDWDYYNTIS